MSWKYTFVVALLGVVLGNGPAAALSLADWHAAAPATTVEARSQGIQVRYQTAAPTMLKPPAPVPLPGDLHRLRLWYASLRDKVAIAFVVRDATGAEHIVPTFTNQPVAQPRDREKVAQWSMWRQAESLNLAVPKTLPEQVQPEYRQRVQQRLWPRPWYLVGITVTPTPAASPQKRRGKRARAAAQAKGNNTIWLTAFAMGRHDGLAAEVNWYLHERWRWGWDVAPALFLDDLTATSGRLRYRVTIRQGYQGPVVWQHRGEASVERRQPLQLFAARLQLPTLPAGTYEVHSTTWQPDGRLDSQRQFTLFVLSGPRRAPETLPAAFTWESGQAHHVFPATTTTIALRLRLGPHVWPRGVRQAQVVVRVTDWLGRQLCERTYAKAAMLRIDCAGGTAGTDYTATAELYADGTRVDRTALHYGIASPTPTPTTRPLPPILSRDELLRPGAAVAIAEHWGSLLWLGDRPINEAKMREFDQWLREEVVPHGFAYVSIRCPWFAMEPLPGVYRWAEIERRIELARTMGKKVFLFVTSQGPHEPEAPLWWHTAQPMLDHYGYVARVHESALVSPTPWASYWSWRDGYRRWLTAVAEHFRDNPTVVGYRIAGYRSQDAEKPEYRRTDYAPVSQQAFAAWQRQRGKRPTPLTPLFNLPDSRPGPFGPDLSSGWQDAMAFRVHTYTTWLEDVLQAIRTVDPQRPLSIYRGAIPTAMEAGIPLLRDRGASFHDEGGPNYFARALESMSVQGGVPYTNEGHRFVPNSRAIIDAGFFYGACCTPSWSWLYRWNVRAKEKPRFRSLPTALAFLHASMPAVRDWVAATGAEPEVLVFGSRLSELLGNQRRGRYRRIAGVELFTGLFSYHQVPAHFANEYTDWVDLQRFRVVFVVGEIMSAQAIERLTAYAKQGGKVVLVGDAGRFSPEQPRQRDVLRQRLQGAPHVKRIAAPALRPPPPGPAVQASQTLAPAVVNDLLAWAGIQRRVWTTTADGTGLDSRFESSYRSGANGQVYVAVFRRFPKRYTNIWEDEKVAARWGQASTQVTVAGLRTGPWRVEQIHRTPRQVRTRRGQRGELQFSTAPATVGELQLFRLTPER